MKNIKLVILILCLLCLITACGNSTERKVQGTWYSEYWTWEFNSDGTLERKDAWGETNYESTWEVIDDTHILVGDKLILEVESLTDEYFISDANGITWSFSRTPKN